MGYTVEGLISTSVDDCKTTLGFITDVTLLRRLYVRSLELGYKTKAKLAQTRIKQLKKGGN